MRSSAARRLTSGRLTCRTVTTGDDLAPVTPGEVLREEFMLPLKLSARALARDIDVPANRITEILRGERDHRRHGAAPWTPPEGFSRVLVEPSDGK